jgi:hypothetical protein
MKLSLVAILVLALLNVACNGGGGSSSKVDPVNNEPQNTDNDEVIVKPSTINSGSSNDKDNGSNNDNVDKGKGLENKEWRFINNDTKNAAFSAWSCISNDKATLATLRLSTDANKGNHGVMTFNDSDVFNVTWKGEDKILTIWDEDSGVGRFSNYQFSSLIKWQGRFETGDVKEDLTCTLRDGKAAFIPVENELSWRISNGLDTDDADLTSWACLPSKEGFRGLVIIYLDNQRFGLSFTGEDGASFGGTWKALSGDEVELTADDSDLGVIVLTDYQLSTRNKISMQWPESPPFTYSCDRRL